MNPASNLSPVLDASAALAVLQQEPGADRVCALLPDSAMSAVNAAEVLARLIKKGMPHEDAIDSFEALGIQVIPFGFSEAAASARFITSATIAQGLSLGDRACLATAQLRGAKAVTSDRAWRIPNLGVEVDFLR